MFTYKNAVEIDFHILEKRRKPNLKHWAPALKSLHLLWLLTGSYKPRENRLRVAGWLPFSLSYFEISVMDLFFPVLIPVEYFHSNSQDQTATGFFFFRKTE